MRPIVLLAACGGALTVAPPLAALSYSGPANQFAGGFAPGNAPYGGFGGASGCTATRTPVVYVHGNGTNALTFDRPTATGTATVYATFRAAGYRDCELFGITWLASSEQGSANVQYNYHTGTKAARIRDFINAVKAYTGKTKVDVIGHSMGVTVAAHGITYGNLWGSIRRFVNVGGALRGLSTCYWVGYANAAYPTCGSQNLYDSDVFGFWQHLVAGASNPRTGASTSNAFRSEPSRSTGVSFYTIAAGAWDEIHCGSGADSACGIQPRYSSSGTNVKAQIDLGSSVITHIPSFADSGQVQVNMLTGSCTGIGCCSGYSASTCRNL